MATVNPRVDFAFKMLFGAEENKAILIAFINAVVNRPRPITDVQLLNPYNNKKYPADKLSILDIKATDEVGRQYNIEMQITDQAYYNQRALYYWSRLYTSQLRRGDAFDDLKQTISINVLNFNSLQGDDYHNIFRLLSVKTLECYCEDLEIHVIELDKFDKDLAHLKTALDRWANFLKRANQYKKDDIPIEMKQDPAIVQAIESLDRLYLTDEEREIYEARLKWYRDEAGAIKTSWLKGKAAGIEIGIEKGMEEAAIRMLKMGAELEFISEISGFTIEKIKQLQAKD